MRRRHHFGLAATLGFFVTYISAHLLRRHIHESRKYWANLTSNVGREATPEERSAHRRELH